jgi:hypothetical protein
VAHRPAFSFARARVPITRRSVNTFRSKKALIVKERFGAKAAQYSAEFQRFAVKTGWIDQALKVSVYSSKSSLSY